MAMAALTAITISIMTHADRVGMLDVRTANMVCSIIEVNMMEIGAGIIKAMLSMLIAEGRTSCMVAGLRIMSTSLTTMAIIITGLITTDQHQPTTTAAADMAATTLGGEHDNREFDENSNAHKNL